MLGELKTGGLNSVVRAVLVAVEISPIHVVDGNVSNEDKTQLRGEITKICKAIGLEGGKEYWGFGYEASIIKAWCEALKSR